MGDFMTPVSLRSTRGGKKWTVSPEFGDALLIAMREKSHTSGPLPRLPSMLQLPSPTTPRSPTLPSPTKKDGAERLTMRTRVAIRDKDPHKFQVVPLRDADSLFQSCELERSRERQHLEEGMSRVIQKKPPIIGANENDLVPPVKIGTSERPKILSERNKNVPLSSFETPILGASRTEARHIYPKSLLAHSKQPKQRPSPTTSSKRNTIHFKSPSLGNLRSKPNLDIDLELTPLPRVTSCRKRTNTLSAERASLAEVARRRDLEKKDSVRRHAIYTQSLYVPVHERPASLLPDDTFADTCPMHVRSSIPATSNPSETSLRLSTALGFMNMENGSLEDNMDCLHSMPSSIYLEDVSRRPLTYCRPPSNPEMSYLSQTAEIVEDVEPLKHHLIILELLCEVEKAMLEWSLV
ncbi:hypothetical protein H0H87_002526 [Tephrocybe sp. NHM501043]|nr:hypothetical protein H0H87_002526 [Tephrocybe sp. NHM501043]